VNLYEQIEALRDAIPGAVINEGPEGGAAAGALFSGDGTYRYAVWRSWGKDERTCAWIKHNPSKASGVRSDMTFTSAIDRAQRWGFGSLLMVNLAAYVATDPSDLRTALDPIGPGNRRAIDLALGQAQVMVGWGNLPPGRPLLDIMLTEVGYVMLEARKREVTLWCLGKNANTTPKHLLSRGKGRIPKDAQPERWR
jgi:hypothetical protein